MKESSVAYTFPIDIQWYSTYIYSVSKESDMKEETVVVLLTLAVQLSVYTVLKLLHLLM